MPYKDKERARARSKRYYDAHREEIIARNRAWIKANPDKVKALRKADHEAHRDRNSAQNKAWREAHKDEQKVYHKAYRESHREERKALCKQWQESLRKEVLEALGGKCACCGETEPEFLAIDHINGDGAEHRRKIGKGIYSWLKKNDYPPGFQVLCHNCNIAKSFYGVCPHQEKTL